MARVLGDFRKLQALRWMMYIIELNSRLQAVTKPFQILQVRTQFQSVVLDYFIDFVIEGRFHKSIISIKKITHASLCIDRKRARL
jgi:hypothetical protein